MVIIIVQIVFIHLEQKTNFNFVKVCDNKDFCNTVMPDKALFIIYADLESLIVKIDGCKSNLEKLSATKLREHIPSGFQHLSRLSSFKDRKYVTAMGLKSTTT